MYVQRAVRISGDTILPMSARVHVGQQFADLYNERYRHSKAFDTIGELTKVASDAGTPIATLSIAWVRANPTITSVVLGASRPDQLTDTLLPDRQRLVQE